LVVFGHIHEGYGMFEFKYHGRATTYINCSHVNEHYEPVNEPVRIIYKSGRLGEEEA
jgi:hypothetical protein